MGPDSTVLSTRITRTGAAFGKKIVTMEKSCRNKWIPVATAWGVLRLQLEEWPPDMDGISAAAVNISNKQLHTANKGWSTSLGLGEVLRTPRHKNLLFHKASGLE